MRQKFNGHIDQNTNDNDGNDNDRKVIRNCNDAVDCWQNIKMMLL